MKDIDFDELDKAVNSLMGGMADTPEPTRIDDGVTTIVLKSSEPTQKPASSDAPVSAPSLSTPVTVGKPATVDSPQQAIVTNRPSPISPERPTPSLATRRSGRFMDVMHPSSDMAKLSAPVADVPRHSGAIEPLHPTVVQDVTPAPATPFVPAPAPVVPEPVVESEWPDPLDMLDIPEQDSSDVPVVGTADDAPAPLVSPFLPDAKVEKRPLGGFVQDEPAETPDATPTESTLEQAAPELQTEAPATAVALPQELQGDLMAIESRQADTMSQPVETEAPAMATASAQPLAAPHAPQPSGPASIQQQYKEMPSTGDQTNGAIYDTDAYHKPIDSPVKKKRTWIWIVWIVVLLLVGAGGGAAAYLFLLK